MAFRPKSNKLMDFDQTRSVVWPLDLVPATKEPKMTDFLSSTLSDIRGGRQSWRVFLAVCAPSFAVTLALQLAF